MALGGGPAAKFYFFLTPSLFALPPPLSLPTGPKPADPSSCAGNRRGAGQQAQRQEGVPGLGLAWPHQRLPPTSCSSEDPRFPPPRPPPTSCCLLEGGGGAPRGARFLRMNQISVFFQGRRRGRSRPAPWQLLEESRVQNLRHQQARLAGSARCLGPPFWMVGGAHDWLSPVGQAAVGSWGEK